jgi:hypothetical protein
MAVCTLEVLDKEFTIHRLEPNKLVPEEVLASTFVWLGRTDEELSVVCASGIAVPSAKQNSGWSCLRVVGPIDFSLTGVLAGISSVLAAVNISIFALSTFDTDYILVKSADLATAQAELRKAGYRVSNAQGDKMS